MYNETKKRCLIIEFDSTQLHHDFKCRHATPIVDDVSSISSASNQSLNQGNRRFRNTIETNGIYPMVAPLLCPILPRPTTSIEALMGRPLKKLKPLTPNGSTKSGYQCNESQTTVPVDQVLRVDCVSHNALCFKTVQGSGMDPFGFGSNTPKFTTSPFCNQRLSLPPSLPTQLVRPQENGSKGETIISSSMNKNHLCPPLMHFVHKPSICENVR